MQVQRKLIVQFLYNFHTSPYGNHTIIAVFFDKYSHKILFNVLKMYDICTVRSKYSVRKLDLGETNSCGVWS